MHKGPIALINRPLLDTFPDLFNLSEIKPTIGSVIASHNIAIAEIAPANAGFSPTKSIANTRKKRYYKDSLSSSHIMFQYHIPVLQGLIVYHCYLSQFL